MLGISQKHGDGDCLKIFLIYKSQNNYNLLQLAKWCLIEFEKFKRPQTRSVFGTFSKGWPKQAHFLGVLNFPIPNDPLIVKILIKVVKNVYFR